MCAPRPRTHRARRGVTLVEGLVVGALLGVAALGARAARGVAARLEQSCARQELARGILHTTMERLKADPQARRALQGEGASQALLAEDAELLEGSRLRASTRAAGASGTAAELVLLELELTWTDRGVARSATLTSGVRR